MNECKHEKLRTIISRKVDGTVLRRKRCEDCGYEIFTKEVLISKESYLALEKVYQYHTRKHRR